MQSNTSQDESVVVEEVLAKGLNTPMMQQFFEAKAVCPEALLLFRMGDFYELFLEDAVIAAELLDLTLTSRNKKDENPIPMAGVPYHALNTYLPRLLMAGKKVAICDQVEDPKLAKGLVRREVVRVITPGVVLEEAVLDKREPNWLAALVVCEDQTVALAWLDASTGERKALKADNLTQALTFLAGLEPKEVLVADKALFASLEEAVPKAALSYRPLPEDGTFSDTDDAAALVVRYARELYRSGELALRPLELVQLDHYMVLPPSTVRNLELLRSLMDGDKSRSLLAQLDLTRCVMGSRLLRAWLLTPLVHLPDIERRHDLVQALLESPLTRERLRTTLRGMADLERLVGRVCAGSATPRDVVALASSLERIPELDKALVQSGLKPLQTLWQDLDKVDNVASWVRATLVDEPPANLKDGGIIREGAHPELDELFAISREGKDWFFAYGERLREHTKIPSLKIKFNSVFGYFIEVTKANLHMVPKDWLRKQTLVNAERYYTLELKEREDKVLGADERRLSLEEELFTQLREAIAKETPRIQALALKVAELDVLCALAEVAALSGWTRPTLSADPSDCHLLHIEAGRHPVVESQLPPGSFVPNDLDLSAERRLIVLTGPNMAGKSTVMRQTALIAILAQMGSFVPATRVEMGLVDKIFTRVGASDDLARGQSTFMVEMTEAAEILREATPRSLVVLDEIGRGTSTWDGLSIAWAVAEFMHDQVRSRALFATHYHELTNLAVTREAVANLSIAVREDKGKVLFLRKLVPGGASKSYGIQVARLAGLPDEVLARAKEVLRNLEAMAVDPESKPRLAGRSKRQPSPQLGLFDEPAPPQDPVLAKLKQQVLAIDPDSLTPRAALEHLYALRALLDGKGR